ncbi:DUF1294 domain-containing protein [Phenylobacterium sp.]|jgi:uncharacterized membrane protein YsdA (DUF1294 family)|uniref:DUF1294 domain-containing protein n=1 Tax=Phenylobacterium sp. TaxID=1871053 RepID=UPI002F94BD50
MWPAAVAYFAALNVATFVAFGLDKHYAVTERRRIPERTLLTVAALGGSAGALLARPVFRHKTRKEPFGGWLRLIVWGQCVAAGAVAVYRFM